MDRTIRIVLAGSSTGAVRAMAQVGTAAEVTEGKLDRMHTAGQRMAGVGRTMTQLALPMVALGGYAVKTAATFQDSMTLLRTQVGVGQSEVTKMSSAIQGLTPKVGEGPRALAAALYPIESVGLRGSAALAALKAAAMGAQVSGASLTDTADAISGALRTQMSDVRSASDAMSIMNGIVAQGKMHLTDLTGAMSTGILPAAKAAGLGFRDVGGALAAMTRQGIPAQDEATRLKLNLLQMEAPKGQALKAFSAIGLGQFKLADDLRKPDGLITALLDLRGHLQRLPRDQQNLALSMMFGGARGSGNITGLLNALPAMQQVHGQLQGAGAPQLQKAFGLRQKDMSYQWGQFKANSEAAMVGLGNAIMPLAVQILPRLTRAITDVSKWFTQLSPGLKRVLLWGVAFVAVGGPVLMFMGRLVTGISGLFKAVKFLATTSLPGFGGAAKAAEGEAGALRLSFLGLLGPIALAITAFELLHKTIKLPAGSTPKQVGHTLSHLGVGFATGDILSQLARKGAFGHGVTVQHHALGGPIRHLMDGGSLGGYGGGDSVPAVLEPGEFVMRKEAAQTLGAGALNSMNQTGTASGAGGGSGEKWVTMPITIKLSNGRVLAEEVVHFAAKRSGLSGHYVSG